MIQLDTSFLIRSLARETAEARKLRAWIRARENVVVSAIAWTEFLCGPLSTFAVEEAAELLGEPLAFDAIDAILAAELFNASGRRRGTLLDCMIAALAIRHDARLATNNVTDFQRFSAQGLNLA